LREDFRSAPGDVSEAVTRPALALIGFGPWGRNIARNLSSLGALRMICDSSPAARDEARRHYGDAAVVAEVATALEDPGIHACVIATPAASHAELGRLVLEAGKDVLVEKPLALTVADGERLVELAVKGGRVLMVGHVLEYHPAVEKLRELVGAGELGELRYVYSNRLNLGRIRTEENALWSFAPHDLHVILGLVGEPPTDVACRGGSYVNRGVADVTMSTLSFASRVRAHVFVSWLHPYKDHKLVVVGDRKMLVFDDARATDKLHVYPHRVDWIESIPIAVKLDPEPVPIADEEPLAVECRHFLECIRTRKRPRTGGESAVAVLRVLEACQRSLEREGMPVRLDDASDPTGFFAHPTATIDAGCRIGPGTRVWHYSHVMTGARIGRECVLGQSVFIGQGVDIGDNVKIQNNVSVYEGVTLEDDVFCGPSAVFTNVLTPRSHVPRRSEFRATRIRRGATVGANATVVCGHDVGRHAFIGAGAVVTDDVPDHALVVGVPARLVGWVCECGVRLPLGVDAREEVGACPACGTCYARTGLQVRRADPSE
jgi:UDP-2-acetamido-3-amino-2,3-dideoxy-glucuronate N-acetyltransferase